MVHKLTETQNTQKLSIPHQVIAVEPALMRKWQNIGDRVLKLLVLKTRVPE